VTVIPIARQNRKHGVAKLKIKEMGSRYFFICAPIWLEKYFSRGATVASSLPLRPRKNTLFVAMRCASFGIL
jgi:hypothetical protein